MTGFTRRSFLGALLTLPMTACRQYQTKPADEITVDHTALVDIATVVLKTYAQNPQGISQAPTGQEISRLIARFNDNLKKLGYEGEKANVGALFMATDNVSFRIGDQGIIAIAENTINHGAQTIRLETAHEFGHLYYRHNSNQLFAYHPQIYEGNNGEVLRIQKTYAHIFNQVNIDYERLHAREISKINVRLQEKQAEEMAVRQTCLSELSLKLTNEALSLKKNRPANIPPAKWNELLQTAEGQREGAFSPLPPACGPVRRAMGLNATPILR